MPAAFSRFKEHVFAARPLFSRRALMPARNTSSLALAAALILGGLWLLSQSFRGREHSQLDRPLRHSPLSHPGHVANVSLTTTRRRKNVAVASSFGAHFDVYMAFVKTLGDVMDEDDMDGQVIHLFAPEFNHGFQELTDEFHLWTHRGIRADQDHLIDHVNSNVGDGGVDLIVFGTCEFE